MSNYSDNPSMDEILARIKKALSDREKRVEEESFYDDRQDDFAVDTSFLEVKEFAKTPEATKTIVDNIVKDDILIKPNLKNPSSKEDVFVLTNDMKIDNVAKLEKMDFETFCENISSTMSKDLSMAYMSPKIYSWLKNNFWDVVNKSAKK